MKKSTLLMVLSLVLALALGVGGTMAYLQDTDADVNVMTLGNVYITQNEQEYNAAGELVEFTQDKPLYPYVGQLGWKNTEEANGAYRQFTMNNVVDKYVTVTNTGKSDAYVRTLIAFEAGECTLDEFKALIGISRNALDGDEFDFDGTWVWDDWFETTIDGQRYFVRIAEHQDALAPGETTIPSLNQIYLKNTAGNEEVEKLDGNGNGKYDVLVLSQAVQTQGFADANGSRSAADEALNEAFPRGEGNANVAGWFEGWAEWDEEIGSPGDKWLSNNPPSVDAKKVNTLDDLQKEAAEGGTVWLTEEIVMTDDDEKLYAYPGYVNLTSGVVIDKDTDLYLNGISYTDESLASLLCITKLDSEAGSAGPVVNIYADNGAVFSSNDPEGTNIIAGNRGAIINIYGGTYVSAEPAIIDLNGREQYGRMTEANIYDGFFYTEHFSNNDLGLEENMKQNKEMLSITSNSYSRITCYGGTYVNFNPDDCYDGDFVPDGYKVIETPQANGDVWFTVVAE